MDRALDVDIITPRGTVFQGKAVAVTLPGTVAPFQVLYQHAPILSTLEPGVLKILLPDLTPVYYAIGSGFVEVLHNHVAVLVESIVAGEEIDLQQAAQRLQSARAQLNAAQTRDELRRARQELREAEINFRTAQLARARRQISED
ncbi:MAG: ATP synthase F1 subunit epsilon [Candidatus Kapabacteria bacterium]|nr:ATP synthase F1 subunit epsilon [Candidatus Kapabacteria bacterium]MDW8012586.1 ATP synthase F1 subunit epsilon [Bacteroidota bacterium]